VDTYVKMPVSLGVADIEKTVAEMKLMLKAGAKVTNSIIFTTGKNNVPDGFSEFGTLVDSMVEDDVNYAIVRVNSSWYHILDNALSGKKTLGIKFTNSMIAEMSISPWELVVSDETPEIGAELYITEVEFASIGFLEGNKPTINGHLYPASLIEEMIKECIGNKYITIDGYNIPNIAIAEVNMLKHESIAGKIVDFEDGKFVVQIFGPQSVMLKSLINNNSPMMLMPRGMGEVVIIETDSGERQTHIQVDNFKLICLDVIYNKNGNQDIPDWFKFEPIETITMLA